VARLASLVAFRYDSASAKKTPVPAMTWLSVFIERHGAPPRFVRLGAVLGASLALAGCGALFDDSYESTTAEVTELAEQGDAAAQAALGQRLEAGLGTPRDVDQALAWYRESAMQGDPLGQFLLAQLYESGDLGAPDHARAAQWYMRAAARSHPEAQAALGRLYETGQGVPQSYRRAADWYLLAAAQWDASQRYPLGAVYATGRSKETSEVEAVKWYRRAAELGVAEAQFDLGRALELGHGVAQDHDSARGWYREAAAQGHDRAAEALARLGSLDPDTIPPTAARRGDPPELMPAIAAADGGDAGAPLAIVPAESVSARQTGAVMVHLASYRYVENAETGWNELLGKHGDLLGGLGPMINRVEIPGKGTFYRLKAGPVDSLDAAKRLCAGLKARGAYCDAKPTKG
jgi:TPR repeat protein